MSNFYYHLFKKTFILQLLLAFLFLFQQGKAQQTGILQLDIAIQNRQRNASLNKLNVFNPRNLEFLKEDTTLNLVYNYDSLRIGKFTEQEFIDRKVKDPEDQKWLNTWYNDRRLKIQPAFQRSMNYKLRNSRYTVRTFNKTAKYTLLVKTRYIDPLRTKHLNPIYNKGFIVVDFIFYETVNPENIYAISRYNSFQLAGGSRTGPLKTAYELAGEHLGKYLSKEVLGKRKN